MLRRSYVWSIKDEADLAAVGARGSRWFGGGGSRGLAEGVPIQELVSSFRCSSEGQLRSYLSFFKVMNTPMKCSDL